MGSSFVKSDKPSAIDNVSFFYVAQGGLPPNECTFVGGVATFVSANLAVTCRHTLDDFLERIGTPKDEPEQPTRSVRATKSNAGYSLKGVQITQSKAALWSIRKTFSSNISDLALLLVVPANDDAQSLSEDKESVVAKIRLALPRVGETVSAYGFPHSKILSASQESLSIKVDPYSSEGTVQSIHPLRRDNLMPFPCFQTNCRFDSGMSGGPIFNSMGELCGVIGSGYDLEDGTEPIGYGIAIWPTITIEVEVRSPGGPNQLHTIYDLAREHQRFLHVADLDKIECSPLGNGETAWRLIDA